MIKSFTIDRKKWYRGQSSEHSALVVNNDPEPKSVGKMCCVGFYAKACGLTKNDMVGRGTIEELYAELSHLPTGNKLTEAQLVKMVGRWTINEQDINHIYTTNDQPYLAKDEAKSEKVREREIKRLFKKHGITVKFIN